MSTSFTISEVLAHEDRWRVVFNSPIGSNILEYSVMATWLKENLNHHWRIANGTSLVFDDYDEALMFYLRFK